MSARNGLLPAERRLEVLFRAIIQAWTSSQNALGTYEKRVGQCESWEEKCKDHNLGRTSSGTQIGQFQESPFFSISLG